MARTRKTTFAPGSILPESSIVSRVLERDRQSAGRRAPEEIEPPPAQLETAADGDITSNITAQTAPHISAQEEAQSDDRAADKAAAQPPARKGSRLSSQTGSQAAAQQRAQDLAATRMIPITLRIPEGLNDWLDEEAHKRRKGGVKKQDLVSRAVQLLVIEASKDQG